MNSTGECHCLICRATRHHTRTEESTSVCRQAGDASLKTRDPFAVRSRRWPELNATETRKRNERSPDWQGGAISKSEAKSNEELLSPMPITGLSQPVPTSGNHKGSPSGHGQNCLDQTSYIPLTTASAKHSGIRVMICNAGCYRPSPRSLFSPVTHSSPTV